MFFSHFICLILSLSACFFVVNGWVPQKLSFQAKNIHRLSMKLSNQEKVRVQITSDNCLLGKKYDVVYVSHSQYLNELHPKNLVARINDKQYHYYLERKAKETKELLGEFTQFIQSTKNFTIFGKLNKENVLFGPIIPNQLVDKLNSKFPRYSQLWSKLVDITDFYSYNKENKVKEAKLVMIKSPGSYIAIVRSKKENRLLDMHFEVKDSVLFDENQTDLNTITIL